MPRPVSRISFGFWRIPKDATANSPSSAVVNSMGVLFSLTHRFLEQIQIIIGQRARHASPLRDFGLRLEQVPWVH